MRLRELESLLQGVEPFREPKVELEQYPTGAHLAARLLHAVAHTYGELAGAAVLDLGAGTGMLALGAAALGAGHVFAAELDADALEVAAENLAAMEEELGRALPVDFVRADVRQLKLRERVDVVLMNPPFGARRRGADAEFLRAALPLARRAVYSLHKSSTRAFVAKAAARAGARAAEVVAEMRYDLPATYKFHRAASKDIEVDLWRFEVDGE
jgi:predicted RNA methylase